MVVMALKVSKGFEPLFSSRNALPTRVRADFTRFLLPPRCSGFGSECSGLTRLREGYHAATVRQPIEGRYAIGVLLRMIFIETPIFTKRLKELLTDDSYLLFQRELADRPDLGDVIEGTGGIRKVRVASSGHGKRGGSRVIYYHFTSASQIALLLIYPKNEKDDLSADERKALKQIIERWR